jgi:hypothetical protein
MASEFGFAAADQRQRRQEARHRGELVEEVVLRTEHDRRPKEGGVGFCRQHGLLAFGLGAGVARRRMLVGADRRDMDHARAVIHSGQCHLLGAERLHGVEALPAALVQDADQVDDDVGTAYGRFHRTCVPHVGLHRMDLADPAERL